MEPASVQIARPLPRLVKKGSTQHPPDGGTKLARSLMHPWPNFANDVRTALQGVDLSGMISSTDDHEGEVFYVGNELGLTGRFVQNVGIPITKAFQFGTPDTALNLLRFSDYHAGATGGSFFPDVAIVQDNGDSCDLRAVGEVKTYWTLPLQNIPVTAPDHVKALLEAPIGQLVGYMRGAGLRFGFLSTYMATVFVRRMDDFRFDLSPPIMWNATSPSVRECFVALGAYVATETYKFDEPEALNAQILEAGGAQGSHASNRPSALKNYASMGGNTVGGSGASQAGGYAVPGTGGFRMAQATRSSSPIPITVTSKTVFLSTEPNDLATSALEYTGVISGMSPGKVVINAIWHSSNVVVKFWPYESYFEYVNELEVYQRLEAISPRDGFPFFARLLGHGEIVCSSIILKGHAIILTKVAGEQFSDELWRAIGPERRELMTRRLIEAVKVLRSVNTWNRDAGKHNVLYDVPTGNVAMVDFEQAEDNSIDNFDAAEGPEIWAIMSEPSDTM